MWWLWCAALLCPDAFGQNPSLPAANASVTAAEDRESIIVTGVYEPIPLDEADRAVRAMEIDTMQKLLSNTVLDFLRLDPSLDVGSRAPNGVQTDLSIRGGDFEQTLVLVDGIRMTDPQSGHHDMDIPLPPDAVGRVEILKGAGSAIYGSDAMGGVVKIITRPPESNELDLRAGIGNFGVNQQSAALTTVWQDLTEQLSFSRDFSSGFTDDRDYRNLSFASLTHWHSSFRGDGPPVCSPRATARSRSERLLRTLQFLGANQNLARGFASDVRQEHRGVVRVPAPYGSVCAVSQRSFLLHESSCRGGLPGGAAASQPA